MSLCGIPTKYAARAVFRDGSRTQGEGGGCVCFEVFLGNEGDDHVSDFLLNVMKPFLHYRPIRLCCSVSGL